MDIEELHYKYELSKRSYHACKQHGINTLYELNSYYKKNRNFLKLRNCGINSNLELIELCISHEEHKEDENDIDHYELETSNNDILNIPISEYELSVRSYNICLDNKLINRSDLLNYFQIHKDFSILKNCGKRSNLELIELCYKYNKSITDHKFDINFESIKLKLKDLNETQKQIISHYIKVLIKNLSNRGRNAITNHLRDNLIASNYIEYVYDNKFFHVAGIKNIGKDTLKEVQNYIDTVNILIEGVQSNTDQRSLLELKSTFLLQNIFEHSQIPDDISQSNNIFRILEYLINNSVIFQKNKSFVFQNLLNIYLEREYDSLEKTAARIHLTKERVRQLRVKVFSEIFDKFNFLENFQFKVEENYNLDFESDLLFIDTAKINGAEQTSFSKQFIYFVFFHIYRDKYTIIGNVEDVFILKESITKNRHNWNDIYLVKNKMEQFFDFNAFINDLYNRQDKKIEETYNFNFKSYLARFLKIEDFSVIDSLSSICEVIINNEFNLYLNLDDDIVFERNTFKQLYEYVEDVLDELNNPSSISDIYSIIETKYVGLTKSAEALRGSINRSKKIICFGRTSTYGLKKWEKERENIKGGTIRSITEEYLEKFDIPKHSSEILMYVKQFRPNTNERSVATNLQLDNSNVFVFFKDGLIGLSDKKYDPMYILRSANSKSNIRTWEESYTVLADFVNKNKRLPHASRCSNEERVIYRWLNVQKTKIRMDELIIDKAGLIESLLEKFPNSIGKARVDVADAYGLLIDFVNKNNRLPNSRTDEEKVLNGFYRRQVKQYKQNDLTEERYLIIGQYLKDYARNKKVKSNFKKKKTNILKNNYDTLLNFVKFNKRLPPSKNHDLKYLNKFFFEQQKLFKNNEMSEQTLNRYRQILYSLKF